MLGEIGDSGAGAVGIRSFHDRADGPQGRHDLVGDPTDDLRGCGARCVKAVERVEHRGRDAAQEREFFDQQDLGSAPSRSDSGSRSGRAGADDHHVEATIEGCHSPTSHRA